MTEDKIELVLDDLNKATIYLHGATVTSWICNGDEMLFLSKKAVLDNKKAIRGGIPIVFPNFGPWDNDRPQHGFARIKRWSIKEPISTTDDFVTVTLSLKDDSETKKLWNFSFELLYKIKLDKFKLDIDLTVINFGMDAFDFTVLFHTYFRCDAIENVELETLRGCEYVDKVQEGCLENETNKVVKINEEVDRVYQNTPNTLTLVVNKSKKTIEIKKKNLPDTVVWNPWIEKAKAMSDFDDEEYKQMVCVESGYVSNRFVLFSKSKLNFTQELKVLSDSLDINMA